MSSDTLSPVQDAPCPDDVTVHFSNVTRSPCPPHACTPDPNSSPDDDPVSPAIMLRSTEQGGCHAPSSIDDDPFDLQLNAIDINLPNHLPSADIEPDITPCHDPSANDLRELNPLAVPKPSASSAVDDEPRAQFDTGAFAS